MITKRQKEVLDFIKTFKKKNEYAPSLDEIRKHLKIDSISTAHYHINKLQEAGYLEKLDKQARGIDIVKDTKFIKNKATKIKDSLFSVPIYGVANAGEATIVAEENLQGYVKIPSNLSVDRDGVFAIQAQGDSMNLAKIGGKNIENGDFVLIDSEYRTPKSGDYVLSVIDGMANLKKFDIDKKTKTIRLLSESTNKKHKPIYISSADDYVVNGKIISVIKR